MWMGKGVVKKKMLKIRKIKIEKLQKVMGMQKQCRRESK